MAPLPGRTQDVGPYLSLSICKEGWGLHLRPGDRGWPGSPATLRRRPDAPRCRPKCGAMMAWELAKPAWLGQEEGVTGEKRSPHG